MTLIKIGIAGCLGRMGQELVREVVTNKHLNFSGGFEHPNHKNINNNISDLISVNTNHIVSNDSEKIFSDSDVVIDFTTSQSTLQNVLMALEQSTPIVVGTTGLDKKVKNAIRKSSKDIPILQSSNMSVGVNLLFHLVQKASSTLKDVEYDIEIAETHHRHKVDAPSGTAITLGKLAAESRKTNFNKVQVFDRTNSSSTHKTRKKGSIGFAVTRGGEIAGEHTVSYIGTNDRIDLVHKAYNRSIFVKGAIEAAMFISNKKKGLYSMEDVIQLK